LFANNANKMENQVPVCVYVWTIARIYKQLCNYTLLDLIIHFFTLAYAKILLHILMIKSIVVKLGNFENSRNNLLYNKPIFISIKIYSVIFL